MKIPDRIQSKIIERKNISSFKRDHAIRPLVFTNGCFDLIHPGHVSYLMKARELGNFLWIGLNTDSSVKKLKGDKRPINDEVTRAILIASLFFVDAVTLFDEDNPITLLEEIHPDIHVKGGDYKKEDLVEYNAVIDFGGRVEILSYIEGASTTNLIKKIKDNN